MKELPSISSACSWKAGIDLGTTTTVYQDVYAAPADPARASCTMLPTLMAYPEASDSARPGQERRTLIGEGAVRLREELEVFSPWSAAPERRLVGLLDFARTLRHSMSGGRNGRPWGVVACPCDANPDLQRELRAVAGELFERVLLVEEPYLFSVATLANPLTEHGILVDIGARAVRSFAIGGLDSDVPPYRAAPRPALPHGGTAIDQELKTVLARRYHDLALTDLTITRMKEKLGFVAPARREARMKLKLGRSERVLDISAEMREACESIIPIVMECVHRVLLGAPPELAKLLPAKIYLVGGGAALPGLSERVQAELMKEGFEGSLVLTADNPQSILSLGALKWACVCPDEAWEIPLFAFR